MNLYTMNESIDKKFTTSIKTLRFYIIKQMIDSTKGLLSSASHHTSNNLECHNQLYRLHNF